MSVLRAFRNLSADQQLKLAFLFPLLLAVIFFILEIIGTFYLKQLWADGSIMAFQLIQTQTPVIAKEYFRYTTAIWQLPAYISTLLTNKILVTSWLFSFGYMIFPFIGLGISTYVCLKKQRLELLFIILIQFFLVIAPNTLFATGIASEAVVIFWMMALLILIPTKPSNVGIFIFALWLTFNYEIAFLLNTTALYLMWRERKLTKVSCGILSGAVIFQLCLLIGIVIPQSHHVRFLESMELAFNNSFIFLLVAAFIVVIFSMLFPMLKRRILIWTSVLCLWICFRIEPTVETFWLFSYHFRIWVIPAAAVMFIIGYEVFRKNSGKLFSFQIIAITLLFVPITLVEFSVLKDHIIFYERLNSENSMHRGCVALSDERYQFVTNNRYIPMWSLHFYSLLLQNTVNPRTLIYVPQTYETLDADNKFCVIKRYVNPAIHFPVDGRVKYPILTP